MRAEGVATIKTYSFSASHCKNNAPYKSASILTQSSTIMGEKKVLYQRSYKELFKQLTVTSSGSQHPISLRIWEQKILQS